MTRALYFDISPVTIPVIAENLTDFGCLYHWLSLPLMDRLQLLH